MHKLHYFDEAQADPQDHHLKIAIAQGYVPKTCLLVGQVVMGLVNSKRDPCTGCACDRGKCKGRSM